MVTYGYDSWGRPVSRGGLLASTIGTLNPFRYRGYVYDEETQLYYLQSRYYDPELCRFISSDVLLSTGQGVIGCNAFAYCLNEVITMLDTVGSDAIVLYDSNNLGHIGLLIQDENGQWWHFYWGTENNYLIRIECIFTTVTPYTWCIQYDGSLTLDGINSSRQYSYEYDEYMYFSGDFSQSIEYAKNAPQYFGDYQLFSKNCSQVSFQVLAKADTVYSSLLDKASLSVLPKNGFKIVSDSEVLKRMESIIDSIKWMEA